MPTLKIAEAPPDPCRDPEHNPPSMMAWQPGTYEHVCPRCGAKRIFTVQKPTMSHAPTKEDWARHGLRVEAVSPYEDDDYQGDM